MSRAPAGRAALDYERTRAKHDAAYRNIFGHPRTVADALRGVASRLARHLDFETLERLPADFVTEVLGKRHADTLWRVRTVGDRRLYLLVLIEFQSTVDRRMALRMMDYTARILMALRREDLGPDGAYPPILPIVVYNGRRPWSAAQDVRQLFAPAPAELTGNLPSQRYLLIELQNVEPARLADPSAIAMMARLEQARTPDELEAAVIDLVAWIEDAGAPELIVAFRAWVTLVLARRFGAEEGIGELMPTSEEELDMTEFVAGDLFDRVWQWREEAEAAGRADGIAAGRAEGRAQGIAEGRVEGERMLICRLAYRRFGAEVVEEVRPLIDGVTDPAVMTAVADAVLECATGADFAARTKRVVAA